MANLPLGRTHFLIVLIVWQSRLNTSRAIPWRSLPPLGFILMWALTGPLFDFGEIWKFIFIAVTSIVTFLMVFLIQNTQSRTHAALQLKLDELIRSTSGAHNVMLILEDMSLEEIETFRTHYGKLAMTAREKLRRGQADTSIAAITIG
jgi:low affinity Fe/Cu permease